MMEFWHGRLAAEDVEAAWKTAEALQAKAKHRLEDILWPCSICRKEVEYAHYGVADKKDHRFLTHYWKRIMLPGEWRMCLNCKGKLRGEQLASNRKNAEYECKVCHEELPEDRFDAERLKTWRKHCNFDQIVCLQCTPGCAKSWWEKRADSGKYTCSACAQELPRMAYSDEGLCKPAGRICIECNLAQVVQQRQLEKKRFNCVGPCRRKLLPHHEFTATMLLRKNLHNWLCKECEFPTCIRCRLPNADPVTFGPDEQKQLAKKKTNYERKFVCDSCSYPPCSGCGLERTRDNKKNDFKEKMWFCRKCWWQAAKTKQQHPPCSTCGAKKPPSEQRIGEFEHKAWRCTVCWRKADS